MYHPHADEMVQMAVGMHGFWVTHPKTRHPHISEVDRDFCFLLNSFDVEPGSCTQGQHDDRFQYLVLEQPRVSQASIRSMCVRATGCVFAWQIDHDQPPYPPPGGHKEFEVTVPTVATRLHQPLAEVTTDVAVGQMRQDGIRG